MVDVGTLQDGKAQIKKAYGTCVESHPFWKNKNISSNTKFHIFKSSVKSVLLFGCETWKVTIQITITLQTFVNRCLRTIMGIRWPKIISNALLRDTAGETSIILQIRVRKWQWISHTLEEGDESTEKQASNWNPQGAKRRGSLKQTWKRTVLEAEKCGKT